MKLEEILDIEFPFKVRITDEKSMWGLGKEYIIYECKRGGPDSYFLYPLRTKPLRQGITIVNNINGISLTVCELVKEPTYQDIKEVYNNLSKETLDRMVFELNSDMESIITTYGKVWFKLVNYTDRDWFNFYNIQTGEIGYAEDIGNTDNLINLVFPFIENLTTTGKSDLFSSNSIRHGWAHIVNPEHPANKKILEELLDNTNTAENVPQIHYTKEIELI